MQRVRGLFADDGADAQSPLVWVDFVLAPQFESCR